MNLIKTESFQLATYSQGDSESKKLALVLPGKLDTKDYFHMKSHVKYLAIMGYFALSFDPPGTWESKGDIKLYNVTNYIKAINELIKYYGNKPTFVMGHSRGGSMAILAGTTNPNITSFASIMSHLYHKGYRNGAGEEWKKKGYIVSTRDLPPGGGPKEKRFELPYSFFEDQIRYDMTESLKKSTKPKLFIYGKRDVLVPPQAVKDAYSLASQPKELYELDSEHDYRYNPKSIEEVNNVLGDFLQKYYLL
ncbi:MAG: alpha/beta hydrolase [Patescibacteria group bacterium]